MSATAVQSATHIPTGVWTADPTHSSASFAVRHMAVGTFRGGFAQIQATLSAHEDGGTELSGTVGVNSVAVKDENLRAHLTSPEFFDAERNPELSFRSNALRVEGESLLADGQLTIKGQTHPIEAQGTLVGPTEGLDGSTRLGVTLHTTIDRTRFGLNFNAPLPKGGVVLGNDVELTVELELVREEE